jgi:hypothetical protein
MYTEPTHLLNMHRAMTEKDIYNRGIAYMIIREQHPKLRTMRAF